eukprot:comp10287_c0_seq1/m.5094 comp10287_c0_seq1/g.5094  ORF comp10287_c0_seq1/g.5094 comp10287_c0_seq1/m.5094 type:complete len:173 (-) comp10287_c0_seq1:160-678(-)
MAVRIAPTAVVCKDARLEGNITIGEGCVVQPRAHIRAESGPIVVGAGTNIEENTTIVNRAEPGWVMVIGQGCTVEACAVLDSCTLADGVHVECKGQVGPGAVLGTGSVVGALCQVGPLEELPEAHILFGKDHTVRPMHPSSSQHFRALNEAQLRLLQHTLPSFHHLHQQAPA